MENQPFKIGDVVRLKSGGPAMTVDEVNDSRIGCTMYSFENGQFLSRTFKEQLLIAYPRNIIEKGIENCPV